MGTPELTLKNVKEKITKVREHKVSDFLTDEQIEEVKKSNIRGKKNTSFDEVDAYIAEIIARFGYDTYIAWKNGDISEETMLKFILAERTRDAQIRLKIEGIITGAVASLRSKKAQRAVSQILKDEKKLAERN